MSEDASIGQSAEPTTIVQIPTTGDNAVMSAREAARTLASFRHKQQDGPADTQPAPQERPIEAAPEPATQSGDEPDAAPQETEATGETQATDPAAEPPLELPRSWTKDRAEHWAKLDRGTQEFLLDHDRKASAEVRRVQNEAADQLKSLTAKEQAAEQERAKYEALVPQALALMQQQHNAKFPDIKTTDDVTRMAAEDWPRYVMWDAEQKRLASAQYEAQQISQRQAQEKQQKLGEFAKREADIFSEKAPEFADPAKKTKLQESAVTVLRDLGFKDQELGELWRGEKDISLHDHRLQLLLLDGVRYREARASTTKPVPKPVPPVQRPGASQPRGAAHGAEVQNLSNRLDKTSGVNAIRTAAALLNARRAAR
jgi:hypothetical protein